MGTPNYPRDMASEWNKLKRDVKDAFTSANLRTGMAKIGAKVIEVTGELALNAGAKLRARYANNNTAFLVGQHNNGVSPVEGVLIYRPNGQATFWSWGDSETGDGFWAFYDKNGNVILSDDGASGIGLGRPWLSYNVVRTQEFFLPSDIVTSSSFTPVHTISGNMQHPKIKMILYPYITDNDVAQVRLRNPSSGATLYTSGNLSSPAPIINFTADHDEYSFSKEFKYDLEIRRVSGTGPGVGVTVAQAVGRQS